MATIDKTRSGPLLGKIPFDGLNKCYVMKNIVDLTGGPIVDNDIYQCLPIPANTLVMQVRLKMITPAVGTSLAMDIGDAGNNSWDDAVDGKGAAGVITRSLVGTDAYAAAATMGKEYEAADSIDVTMEAAVAITAGPKFEVSALCVDFN